MRAFFLVFLVLPQAVLKQAETIVVHTQLVPFVHIANSPTERIASGHNMTGITRRISKSKRILIQAVKNGERSNLYGTQPTSIARSIQQAAGLSPEWILAYCDS